MDFKSDSKISRVQLGVITALSIVFGLLFAAAARAETGDATHDVFVILLCLNSVILLGFFFFLQDKLLAYVQEMVDSDSEMSNDVIDEYVKDVLSTWRALGVGVVFGALFLLGSMYSDKYVEADRTLIWLYVFMFMHNIMTGIAAHSLYAHLKHCRSVSHLINLDLWDRSSVQSDMYFLGNRMIVYITATVFSIGGAATMFSPFKLGYPIFIFSLVTVIAFVVTFVYPVVPIVNRLIASKNAYLKSVGSEMQRRADLVTDALASDEDLEKVCRDLELVRGLYDSAYALRVFPPGGLRAISSGLYAGFLALLPVILKYLLL